MATGFFSSFEFKFMYIQKKNILSKKAIMFCGLPETAMWVCLLDCYVLFNFHEHAFQQSN